MTTDQIAGQVIEPKGFDAGDAALRKALGEQCLALLRSYRKQGLPRSRLFGQLSGRSKLKAGSRLLV